MPKLIPVVDLFAGPGGLNEGFSRVGEDLQSPLFETIASIEMESSAIKTLTLRAAYRSLLRGTGVPASYYRFISGDLTWDEFTDDEDVLGALESARSHVHQVELGSDDDNSEEIIRRSLEESGVDHSHSPWVLIGGPPCQAYSLAGRSRRANDDTFASDKKHFLYREYLRIIATFSPPVFVMENVKGLLSSKAEGRGMFERILSDLRSPREGLEYEIYSLVAEKPPESLSPSDFVIKAEQFGVPQKRHRVILLGIRKDFFGGTPRIGRLHLQDEVTVNDALVGIPPIRSGISPATMDSQELWELIRTELSDGAPIASTPVTRGGPSMRRTATPVGAFGDWVVDPEFDAIVQHEARSHMVEDLKRYRFASAWAQRDGVSPRLSSFPASLQPNHKNASAEQRPFEDRFRVQIGTRPATTVVSHISKDGHYYIHPDPDQMRSLTVREAARLQSFPDNYFFVGNRTQQYHQVGNAVPPLLAHQIAKVVSELFIDPEF